MELDIFLPGERLVFEYHGEHHYINVYGVGNWETQQHDRQKLELCNENGITLIEIPFWWDKQLTTLIATIQGHRPNLTLCEKKLTI